MADISYLLYYLSECYFYCGQRYRCRVTNFDHSIAQKALNFIQYSHMETVFVVVRIEMVVVMPVLVVERMGIEGMVVVMAAYLHLDKLE